MKLNMPYMYCIRNEIKFDEEEKEHVVYGIEAVDTTGEILLSFSDVFFDKQKAEDFVNLCNSGRLSLLHFADVVEDVLAE